MIQANELRLGDLVLNDNVLNVIVKISQDGNMILKTPQGNEINSRCELLKPITLTEEWLLKFGFTKNAWDNFSSYRLMIDSKDYTIVTYLDGFFEIGDLLSIEIKYVHQLQNLYHSLTGHELKQTK